MLYNIFFVHFFKYVTQYWFSFVMLILFIKPKNVISYLRFQKWNNFDFMGSMDEECSHWTFFLFWIKEYPVGVSGSILNAGPLSWVWSCMLFLFHRSVKDFITLHYQRTRRVFLSRCATLYYAVPKSDYIVQLCKNDLFLIFYFTVVLLYCRKQKKVCIPIIEP